MSSGAALGMRNLVVKSMRCGERVMSCELRVVHNRGVEDWCICATSRFATTHMRGKEQEILSQTTRVSALLS